MSAVVRSLALLRVQMWAAAQASDPEAIEAFKQMVIEIAQFLDIIPLEAE